MRASAAWQARLTIAHAGIAYINAIQLLGIPIEETITNASNATNQTRIEESIKIIRQALENLPATAINLGNKLPKIQEGMAVCRHEAPRGQLSHMVVGNGSLNNHRVSIHVPSYKNTPTIPVMLRENTVADAGLIVASIDPCFSCLDR